MIAYNKSHSVISVHCHVQPLLMASLQYYVVLKCHLEMELRRDHAQTQSLPALEVSSLKLLLYYAPIKVLPHLPPCGQKRG